MFLAWKAAKVLGVTILCVSGLVAMMDDGDARSLTVTGAEVGGEATDIVITDAIPAFFAQISSDESDSSKG